MKSGIDPNVRYLNLDGQWPGFELQMLERHDDGSLTLATLPRLIDTPPGDLATLPKPIGREGIAVDRCGRVFFTDSANHSVSMIDPCDDSVRRVPCLGGEGSDSSQLQSPRDVVIYPQRHALLVVDTGNRRLQLFDLDTFQLLDVWERTPQGDQLFSNPIAAAVDSKGHVLVVDADAETPRIHRLDIRGRLLASFPQRNDRYGPLLDPVSIDVLQSRKKSSIFVLDGKQRVVVWDEDGQIEKTIQLIASEANSMLGLIVANDAIYVGDNSRNRLLKFHRDGNLIGEAFGYEGPVATLAHDGRGDAWLSSGAGRRPLRFVLRGDSVAFVKQGYLFRPVDKPIRVSGDSVTWHRLQAMGRFDSDAVHVQFAVLTAEQKQTNYPQGGPETWFRNGNASDSNANDMVRIIPRDVSDMIVGGKSRYLWLAVKFQGDGTASPRLQQLRISFDHVTYTKHLPVVYQQRAPDPDLLDRFLSLFESFFVDTERTIDGIDAYFDPATAPEEWLDWLAEWLGFVLPDSWSVANKRQAIRDAYELSAWRGTPRGLRRALKYYAGVDVHIEEPLINSSFWALADKSADATCCPCGSALGFTTRLIDSHPQGAVLGASAVLDHSQLITGEEFGAPLFNDLAHRFSVWLYQSPCDAPQTMENVRRVIDREIPAHTLYQLCIVKPKMRVGFQSILGVDTVVGGRPGPSRLDVPGEGDTVAILAGLPPGHVGQSCILGQTTRLDAGFAPSGLRLRSEYHFPSDRE